MFKSTIYKLFLVATAIIVAAGLGGCGKIVEKVTVSLQQQENTLIADLDAEISDWGNNLPRITYPIDVTVQGQLLEVGYAGIRDNPTDSHAHMFFEADFMSILEGAGLPDGSLLPNGNQTPYYITGVKCKYVPVNVNGTIHRLYVCMGTNTLVIGSTVSIPKINDLAKPFGNANVCYPLTSGKTNGCVGTYFDPQNSANAGLMAFWNFTALLPSSSFSQLLDDRFPNLMSTSRERVIERGGTIKDKGKAAQVFAELQKLFR